MKKITKDCLSYYLLAALSCIKFKENYLKIFHI